MVNPNTVQRLQGPDDKPRLEGPDDNKYHSQFSSRLVGPSPSDKPETKLANPYQFLTHHSGQTK